MPDFIITLPVKTVCVKIRAQNKDRAIDRAYEALDNDSLTDIDPEPSFTFERNDQACEVIEI